MNATPQQWAAWFRASADEADDLTEGQRQGFRIAAEHLESPYVEARVATIELAQPFACSVSHAPVDADQPAKEAP